MRRLTKKISKSLHEAGLNWFTGALVSILLLIVVGYSIYYIVGFIGMIYWATHSLLLTIIAGIVIISLVCAILLSK